MPAPRWRSVGRLDRTLTPTQSTGSHGDCEPRLKAAPSSNARAVARSGAESAAPFTVVDNAPAAFASRTASTRPAPDASDRKPVLTDQRRLYAQTYGTNASNLSVISQGGVTYLAAQKRYVYTSRTEYTFEFYESPTPWGPWKHFMSKDFGGYPWSPSKYGGYGVTIPSKFVQADGKTMYIQANVCPCVGVGSGRRSTTSTCGSWY